MAETLYKYSGADIGADWLAPGAIPTATNYKKNGTDINSLGRACSTGPSGCSTYTCGSTASRYKQSGADIGGKFLVQCSPITVGVFVGVGGGGVGVILP